MKATGIVRRIDELGRVVIPKEIRRTLRIREGDPLEIFTDRDGEVILKKYSPIGEMSEFAKGFTDSLNQIFGHIAALCDKDTIISVSGSQKKELLDQPLSKDLEQAISGRKPLILNRGGSRTFGIAKNEDPNSYSAQVISPVLSDGDVIGAVMLLSKQDDIKMNDSELKATQIAAGFIGKQMEQ